MRLLFFYLAFTLFIIPKINNASHLISAEINYTHISNNNYEISLSIYRDCSGISVDTNQEITYESASCNINFTSTLSLDTMIDISQNCPSSSSTCQGGIIPGYEKWVFKDTVSLQNCNDWIMHWNSGTRSSQIGNLYNPGFSNIYIQNTLNNANGISNSSPIFFSSPIFSTCTFSLTSFTHAAFDIDGDSLYYTLINPKTTPGPPGTSMYFIPTLSAQNPFPNATGFSFDQLTGEMCFTPNTQQYSIASTQIEEFRNGFLIASQIREIYLTVPPCTNQQPFAGIQASCSGTGIITTQNPSVTQTDSNSFNMNINDTLCFDINFSDPDGQDITLTSNVNYTIPSANFTISGNGTTNPVGTFCWSPTSLESGLNLFHIIATDNACPILGKQMFTFSIYVNSLATKLNDNHILEEFKIQPNPNSGIFKIVNLKETDEPYEIEIYNSLGKVILKKIISNSKSYSFNISKFKKGMYFVHVNIDNQNFTRKIIKN